MEAILGIMSLPVLMGILACVAFAEYIYARKHGISLPFLGHAEQEPTPQEPPKHIPEPTSDQPPVHVTFVVNEPQTIVMPPSDDAKQASPVRTTVFTPPPVSSSVVESSPSPLFASVTFKGTEKTYDYLIGDIPDLNIGDRVIVYTRRGKVRRRMATVQYISAAGEKSETARSPIALKIRGRYMASPRGQRYHLPWCMEMDGVTDKNARWFQDDEDARRNGLTRCQKCK